MNQKEVVGIVRHLVKVRIGGNKHTRDTFLVCMRMVARLGIGDTFKVEFGFIKDRLIRIKDKGDIGLGEQAVPGLHDPWVYGR